MAYKSAKAPRDVIVSGWSTPKAPSLMARALSSKACAFAYFPCKKTNRRRIRRGSAYCGRSLPFLWWTVQHFGDTRVHSTQE